MDVSTPGGPLDPSEVVRRIESLCQLPGGADPATRAYLAAGAVVDALILPALEREGRDAIRLLVDARHSSPLLDLALVVTCDRARINTFTVFPYEEIVEGVISYLCGGRSAEDDWAWDIAWGLSGLSDEEHWRLVMEVIRRCPWDDDALWMIGDGPIGQLQMQRDGTRRIDELAREDPKLARILRLVQEIP